MAESSVAKSVVKPTAATHDAAGTSSAAAVRKGKEGNAERCADKCKIPLLPEFRGVDERADAFIAKFRNGMKLEREKSIQEFEEMLKRSAS